TVSVELAIRESAAVADTGKSQRDHAIDELPHPCSTHGHVCTDGLTLPQLELCDGLASPGHARLLDGDDSQFLHRTLDQLGIARRVTHTHVHDDLGQAGNLHGVGVFELFLQLPDDLFAVNLLETRCGTAGGCFRHLISSPVRRE